MIDVFDGVMSCGKSNSIIKEVRSGIEMYNRYLIIVPSLDEVDRYVEDCGIDVLVQPLPRPTKSKHLMELVISGRSVVTTHKLFEMWTDDIADVVENQGYHIIIDEETDCLKQFLIKKGVRDELTKWNLLVEDKERAYGIKWNIEEAGKDYDTNETHNEIKKMCLKYSVHRFGNDVITEYPKAFFNRKNRYSLYTYRFKYSYMKAYLDYNEIDYSINQLLSKSDYKAKKEMFRNLITVISPKTKFFEFNGGGTNFSHTWWKDRPLKELNTLRSNIGMYMKRSGFVKGKSLYCCPKSLSGEKKGHGILHVAPRGYKGDFLAYNAKATNKHGEIENLAYLMNVYPNVNIYRYANSRLKSKGFDVLNKDELALSTLLQCVWRIAIRNSKPIKVLLLSNRMEDLFKSWLKSDRA